MRDLTLLSGETSGGMKVGMTVTEAGCKCEWSLWRMIRRNIGRDFARVSILRQADGSRGALFHRRSVLDLTGWYRDAAERLGRLRE